MKCGHEGISAFVVTRGDPAEVFQAAEHALNGISGFVQDGTEAALPSTGRHDRDVWRGAKGFNRMPSILGECTRQAFAAADRSNMRAGGYPRDALLATLRYDTLEYVHSDNDLESNG